MKMHFLKCGTDSSACNAFVIVMLCIKIKYMH